MKRLFRYLALVMLPMLLVAVSCDDDDEVVNQSELPAVAQAFLDTHFEGIEVARVERDTETQGVRYDVLLRDGTELEFDQNGNWTDVDCKTRAVPVAIVPEPITAYVTAQYPNLLIVQIEHESYGYDIDLSNDLDIRFDPQYNVIRIGD